MSTTTHYRIITWAFGLLALITLVTFFLQELHYSLHVMAKPVLRGLLFLFVAISEVRLIAHRGSRWLGMAGLVIVLVGFAFRVQHWPGARLMILAGSVFLLAVLVFSAMAERNKHLLHYLLMAFLAFRILNGWMAFTFFWWFMETSLYFAIAFVAAGQRGKPTQENPDVLDDLNDH